MGITETVTKLKEIIERDFHGHLPTFSDLKNKYSSLAYHIEKHGGYLHIKRHMGCKVQERKPPKYWNDWDNLSSEITNIMVDNKFPTVAQIKAHLGDGVYKSIRKIGGIAKVATKMGYTTDSILIASDGHLVQSSYEYIVDEFLYANKIPHEVGGLIDSSGPYRYDFKIGDSYIEIWGFQNKRKWGNAYAKRRTRKEQFYKQLNLKLISIEASLFQNKLADIQTFLNKMVVNLTFTPFADFSTSNIVNHTKHWNYNNTLSELVKMITIIGHFPSIQEMTATKGLIYGISKHGGIRTFKKLFNCPPVHRSSWTDEIVKTELNDIVNKLGCFPTCADLRSIKITGLMDAIQTHGGINKFRYEMGYPILKKHKRTQRRPDFKLNAIKDLDKHKMDLAEGQPQLP
jgi:hypothetical protein